MNGFANNSPAFPPLPVIWDRVGVRADKNLGTHGPHPRGLRRLPAPRVLGEGKIAMRCIVGLFFLLTAMGSRCRGQISTTRPWPGITIDRFIETNPPTRYFIVTIDLTNPRIHLKVSRGSGNAKIAPPWETSLLPVAQMAQRDGLTLAVNGNLFASKNAIPILGHEDPYFLGNWARCCGWAMSDGNLYSLTPIEQDWPSLVVSDRGAVSIGRFARLPDDARQVVSGVWQIVTDGQISAPPDSNQTAAGKPVPHTVAGIDRAGNTLILLVVDGHRPEYSLGMGCHRMAEEMLARNAFNAMVLDGGGSTTLVLRDLHGNVNVINHPSDGYQLPVPLSIPRCVANALGVIVDGAPTAPTKP